MKKVLVCFLTVVMLFALSACGTQTQSQPKFKVECTDGVTRELTIAEMYKLYEEGGAQALITDESIVSGTGRVVAPITREYGWNYYNHRATSIEVKTGLDNGITISFDYFQKDTDKPLPDFYFHFNEEVAFEGEISYFPSKDELTLTSTIGPFVDGDEGEAIYIPVWSIEE